MTFDQIFVLSAKEDTLKELQRFVVRRATSIPEIQDKLSPVEGKSLAELLKDGYKPSELGLEENVN